MALSRSHPIFSPIGCLGGLVLLAGIALAVWVTGGAIFSPGELTAHAAEAAPLNGFASHAAFQNDCTQCHAPLAGIDPARCEACHANVAQQRQAGTGLHGTLPAEAAARCQDCHRDHQGRDFDPATSALGTFDHAQVGFALERHLLNFDGAPLACANCHSADFAFTPDTCVSCHSLTEADFIFSHSAAFGGDCLSCHDGVDATDDFDHAQTDFPLVGAHAALDCAACHTPGHAPADTPTTCAACHSEPAVHAGVFSAQDCAACHDNQAWLPAHLAGGGAFDHAATGFQLVNHPLTFSGAPLTCADCHAQAAAGDFSVTPDACANCHTSAAPEFMAAHTAQFGAKCADCHDGAGNMVNFDHQQVFALDGAHAALDCAACHAEQHFRGTANTCAGCHQEPAIHAGLFGAECAACHTTSGWVPAQLTQHTFPLDHGGETDIACATCHTTSYVAYTCAGCHAHAAAATETQHAELRLSAEQLADCAACHADGQVHAAEAP